MPETATVNVQVADMPAVKALIDAVAGLLADPYEAGLHARRACTHDPCTYKQLRMKADELAGG